MMLIHLLGGIAAVGVAAIAAATFSLGWPRGKLETIATWTLGLLALQVASGTLLLTGSNDGPGLLHVVAPLIALALVGGLRLVEPSAAEPSPILGAAFTLAAIGAVVALVTGLAEG